MKALYFIPAYGQSMNTPGYSRILEIMKSEGFDVIPLQISWTRKTMSDYVNQFKEQYFSNHKAEEEVYILGFSFGAMVAAIASSKFVKPKALFLCSLSPYFKEDLHYIKESWKKDLGKKRVVDLENFSFNELAKNIDCKTYLLVGTKEAEKYPDLKRRVTDATQEIKNSELHWIENADHSLNQSSYAEKIKEALKKV